MRSTRGKTRALRAERTQHYTDAAHRSEPVRSNAPTHNPGGNRMNTNTRLKDGGISSYYRSREGLGQ